MEKDWIEYQCYSGETLFVYNKVTGVHKWPYVLPKGTEFRIMHGRPVTYKEFSTTATQTDDNGCNNGCMSMYISTDPSHVSNTSDITLPQQQPGVSDKENLMIHALPTIKKEQEDENDEGQTSAIVTSNQNDLPENRSDHKDSENDPNANTLRDTADQVHNQNLYNISEILRDLEEKNCSTVLTLIDNRTMGTHHFSHGSGFHGDVYDGNSHDVSGYHSNMSIANNDIGLSEDCDDDSRESREDGDDNNVTDRDTDGMESNNDGGNGDDVDDDNDDDNNQMTFDGVKLEPDDNNTSGNVVYNEDEDTEVIGILDQNKFHPRSKVRNIHSRNISPHVVTQLQGNNTNNKEYQCSVCKKILKCKYTLKNHSAMHTNLKKTFKCRLCEKNHWSHFREYNGERVLECCFCKKCFPDKSGFNQHLKVHTKEKPFECPHCKRKFSQKGNLGAHMNTHTGQKPFECEFCGKNFARNDTLKKHTKIHTGDKPYKCLVCGKKVSSKSTLESHIQTHRNRNGIGNSYALVKKYKKFKVEVHCEKEWFQCPLCPKKCNQKSNLRTHIKTHTGEKPFECEFCERKFSQSSHLKEHVKIHTGEKPFECPLCGKKVSRKSSLESHLRTHRKRNDHNKLNTTRQ